MSTAEPYQVMPPLAEAEYEALKASIAAGYDPARPVVVDDDGVVLDGHHRQQACAELGITAPTVTLRGLTEDQKHDYAMRSNLACRHLTQMQKRELIRAELERHPTRSDREIGRLCGADHKTVGSVRRGEIPHRPVAGPTLPVSDVEFVKSLHARSDRRDGEQIIERYRQDVYQLPPITVARGRVLVDGFYRWQAYKRQGIAEIPVEDLGDITDNQILMESVRRNSRHGLPRTAADDEYASSLNASCGSGSRSLHPVAEIFPMMTDDEFSGLLEDIRKHGLIHPIVVHRDGRIIDGKCRYRACRELGIEPETRIYEGDDESLIDFACSMNGLRQHLTEGQIAFAALEAGGGAA